MLSALLTGFICVWIAQLIEKAFAESANARAARDTKRWLRRLERKNAKADERMRKLRRPLGYS